MVERQASEIEIINQMANQQLQSSHSIAQIMQSVSESTQQNSATTRMAAEQMEHMARLAEQLLASVEAFKLREEETDSYLQNNGLPATITPEQEGSLSFSGVFRTITSSIQPTNEDFREPVAAEPSRGNPQVYYPPVPYQNMGNQNTPTPSGTWNTPYQNGNQGNRQ